MSARKKGLIDKPPNQITSIPHVQTSLFVSFSAGKMHVWGGEKLKWQTKQAPPCELISVPPWMHLDLLSRPRDVARGIIITSFDLCFYRVWEDEKGCWGTVASHEGNLVGFNIGRRLLLCSIQTTHLWVKTALYDSGYLGDRQFRIFGNEVVGYG